MLLAGYINSFCQSPSLSKEEIVVNHNEEYETKDAKGRPLIVKGASSQAGLSSARVRLGGPTPAQQDSEESEDGRNG